MNVSSIDCISEEGRMLVLTDNLKLSSHSECSNFSAENLLISGAHFKYKNIE